MITRACVSRRPLALAFLLSLFAAGLTGPVFSATVMDSQVIHHGFIYYYDLGVDPSGHAHAFLDDGLIDQLYYRTNRSGAWGPPENLGHTSDWGSLNVSGTADAGGHGHVAFDGGRAIDSFFYGTNRSGSWVSTSVRDDMRWFALDLGPAPAELPRCAYYDNYSGLNYGTMAPGGSWTHVVVDGSGEIATFAGRYPDLAVDGSDHGHIAYYYYVDQQIRYATNASGTWQWEMVATDPSIGAESYIALAPDGTVSVCYTTSAGIFVARKNGALWDHALVAAVENYGQCDLGVLPDGSAVVVYNESWSGPLMLALENGGGYGTTEILPHAADGEGPALEIQGGMAHVLAWDQNTQDVEYLAVAVDPAGIEETADGLASSLRVCPNPVTSDAVLAFALRRSGPVTIEVADAAGRLVGRWTREGVVPGGSAAVETRVAFSAICPGGDLPVGSYFCRVRSAAGTECRRVLVLR